MGEGEGGSTQSIRYVEVCLPSMLRHVAYEHNYTLGEDLRFGRELPAYIIVEGG